MLAMCDLNNNTFIDIEEVFGERTLNPITKKPLGTKNGFESLRAIAKLLDSGSGTDIIQYIKGNKVVVLPKLKEALIRVGCDLGFIGDSNFRTLEPLSGAYAIRWDYKETPGLYFTDIQHKAKGSFYDTELNQWTAEDIWFKNQK
jgi:hypothetical protein